MFAFAIYDIKKNIIFLARDRAGEKPLFYLLKNNELRFYSELKGLFSDTKFSRKINSTSLDCFLSLGFVPGDMCIIEGVKKLQPAHSLIFNLNNGESTIKQYWHLPEFVDSGLDERELLESLDNLLEDAVNRQLVADVPVGILLSGGVDSSILTAMAARSTDKVKTFTVSFPNFSSHDESQHAKLISKHFKTDHLELNAGKVEPEIMFKLARQFDEPMIDSSMIPTFLVSKLVREHCTVAIGGDGGDELFGGYKHYDRLLRSKEFFSGVPLPIKKIASQISGNILPIGFKGRIGLQNMIADLNTELPTVSSYFDKNYRKRLIDYHQKEWLLMAEEIRRNRTPANSNLLQRITRMDFENYLPEDVLVKVDRASMLNSLEVRAPLLDYRIIEFAFRKVPANLKATTNSRKIILKKLAEKILPDNFDYTRKQGFGIPLANWLRSGPWLDFFKIILLSSEQQLFNHKVVANMIKMHQNGISNNSERLFGLVLFELWRREYDISI